MWAAWDLYKDGLSVGEGIKPASWLMDKSSLWIGLLGIDFNRDFLIKAHKLCLVEKVQSIVGVLSHLRPNPTESRLKVSALEWIHTPNNSTDSIFLHDLVRVIKEMLISRHEKGDRSNVRATRIFSYADERDRSARNINHGTTPSCPSITHP